MGKQGKRTVEEILKWKRSYVENRGYLNLTDFEIINKFKSLRGQEVSISSSRKNQTMLERYGKKSLVTSNTVLKGWISYLQLQGIETQNLTKEEIKNRYYELMVPLQLRGRGETSEEQKKSYLQGLVKKGMNLARARNISIENMSDRDLMRFSGLSKRESFAKLTEEERVQYRRRWKITHLRNYFKDIIKWEDQSNETLRIWYHTYLFASGRLGTKKPLRSVRGKTGWITLAKFGKFFFRSSYEERFLQWCDTTSINIKKVNGNLSGIGYIYEGIFHYYFPDFLLEFEKGKNLLIEIKAKAFLKDPQTLAKLQAGEEYARQNNNNWLIITEKELEELDDTIASASI